MANKIRFDIQVEGDEADDCVIALEEVLRLIREGFTSGMDGNDSSRYIFESKAMPPLGSG